MKGVEQKKTSFPQVTNQNLG